MKRKGNTQTVTQVFQNPPHVKHFRNVHQSTEHHFTLKAT